VILAFIIGFQVTGQPRRHFDRRLRHRSQAWHRWPAAGKPRRRPGWTLDCRESEKRNVRHMAEQKRLSRTHGHTPEIHLQRTRPVRRARVVVAHGNAAAGNPDDRSPWRPRPITASAFCRLERSPKSTASPPQEATKDPKWGRGAWNLIGVRAPPLVGPARHRWIARRCGVCGALSSATDSWLRRRRYPGVSRRPAFSPTSPASNPGPSGGYRCRPRHSLPPSLCRRPALCFPE
jgi:hypothetical protein